MFLQGMYVWMNEFEAHSRYVEDQTDTVAAIKVG